MNTFIVSYDLHRPGQNYAGLIQQLKSYMGWWHHLESTWVIKTFKSASDVRDELRRHLDHNDELLVVQSAGVGAWSGFANEGSTWLKTNL